VYSCSLASLNIKNQAANQQLKNIDEYIAAQSLALLSHTTQDNQNTTQFLDIPTQIGNQIFWIKISNDSSGAWVESGFGTIVASNQLHTNLPAMAIASGIFISGSGRAMLQCHFENQTAILTLIS
ncbi:MAG TPA: hypothetical protein VK253_00375, partial [Candidatus Binatia bacterium]|nr:hypothetical protein [Candidatus Binatia bacterium]